MDGLLIEINIKLQYRVIVYNLNTSRFILQTAIYY